MSEIEKSLAPLIRQFWQPAFFGYLFITGREGYVSNPSSPLNTGPGNPGPNTITLTGATAAPNGTMYTLTITIAGGLSESVNLFMSGTSGTISLGATNVVNGTATLTNVPLPPVAGVTVTLFATDAAGSLSNKLQVALT